MAKDYTMRSGKEATIANNRQRMAQEQRNSTQAQVKAAQMAQSKYQGKTPSLDSRYMDFCAPMMNNGAHAQEFASSLTSGLDKAAFPVRSKADMSQD